MKGLYIKYLIKAIVSFNYINTAESFVAVATSVNTRLSLLEFFTIFWDISVICLFSINFAALYVKYRGVRTSSIKDWMERQLVMRAFFQQKGQGLVLPFSLIKNIFEVSRIMLLFLFLRYKVLFGEVFLGFNIFIIIVSGLYYLKYRKYYIWSFGLFLLGEMFESVVFTLLSVYCIKSEDLIGNTKYHSLITIFIFLWVMLSIIVVLIQMVVSAHFTFTKKALRKIAIANQEKKRDKEKRF